MKKLLISVLALYVLSSCDNRKEYLKTISASPNLNITAPNGSLAVLDSIKLSLKSIAKSVDYKVVIEGNNQEKEVIVKTVNEIGSGKLTFNNEGVGTYKMSNGTYLLRYEPTSEGKTLINIQMKDSFDNLNEYSFQVVGFTNLLPVAKLDLKVIAVNDPREYVLDASGSYDRDARFGGFISSYTFKIGNKTFTTDSPSIKWIFGSAGNYEVGVTITDSDGGTANFTKVYAIN